MTFGLGFVLAQILDVHNPDVRKFPRFVEAEFERVVLEPGEVSTIHYFVCVDLSMRVDHCCFVP